MKWIFTLQISNKLIEACYNQEYGTLKSILGTVYEGASVYKDYEKITIDLQDSSNIVHIKTSPGNPQPHHSFVDILLNNDNRKNTATNKPPDRTESKALSTETIHDLNHSSLSTNHVHIQTKIEANESLEDNNECSSYHHGENQPTEKTVLLNFMNDKTKELVVKLERCDTLISESSQVENFECNHNASDSEKQVLRPKQESFTSVTYEDGSDDNNSPEYDISNQTFKKDDLNEGNDESSEINGDCDDTDEYTMSSEDGFCDDDDDMDYSEQNDVKKSNKVAKTDELKKCSCGFEATDMKALKSHKRNCNCGKTLYAIKIKCPLCSNWCKYNSSGIVRHIKTYHSAEDKKINFSKKLKQNVIDLVQVDEELTCELCNKNYTKFSFPFHIQWEHFVQDFDRSQDILDHYFDSVITMEELHSKFASQIKDFNLIVTTEVISSSLSSENDQSMKLIKVKCPICEVMIAYNESELCKHFDENHSKLGNYKLEMIAKLQDNIRGFANSCQNDNLTCEFCEKVCRKAFFPLHIQWEHSTRNFERSQDILAKYFNTVMTVDELQCVIKDSDMSVTVQGNEICNVLNVPLLIKTSTCEYCGKFVKRMSIHRNICKKNPNRELKLRGFNSQNLLTADENKAACNSKGSLSYSIRVACPVCKGEYKYSRELIIRHIKDKHKDMPNQAELMDKMVQNIIDWEKIEVVSYSENDKLKCEICDAIYNKIFYPIHIQWKHSKRNVEWCRILLCNYFENIMSVNEFSSIELYKDNEVSVNVFMDKNNINCFDSSIYENCCEVIEKTKLAKQSNKTCVQNSEIAALEQNGDVVCPNPTAKQGKTRKCEHCSKFYHKSKLARHRRTCSDNPDRKTIFYCQCGYKCEDLAVIKEHRSACVIEMVICDICGKTLKTKSHYFHHRKFYHGIVSGRGTAIKEYPCEDCNKVYNLPSRLKRHRIRNHLDEKNFICEFCSRAFHFPTALKEHIEFAHNNIYKHYCDKCGHGMSKKSQVKNHVCGRTRKRLKLHEKWMKNIDDKDACKQTKPTKAKTIQTDKVRKVNDNVVTNSQNEAQDFTVDPRLQESSSAPFFNITSSSALEIPKPSVDVVDSRECADNMNTTDAINHTFNIRPQLSGNHADSGIFPVHNLYTNPAVVSGYQYPAFVSSNETLVQPESGYNMTTSL